MDWNRLKIFQTVAETGSLTQASWELKTSQSALSRQIKALEKQIHAPLFQRRAHGMSLTIQGQQLLNTVRRVSMELHDFETGLLDERDQPTGDLVVASTHGLGNSWLVPRLGKFCEQYPMINLRLTMSDQKIGLVSRDVDLAITFIRPQMSEVVSSKLFDIHYGVFASPEYLGKFGVPTRVEDLTQHRILSFGSNAPAHLQPANLALNLAWKSNPEVMPWVSLSSIPALNVAAENGMGIASLPTYLVSSARLTPLLHEHWSEPIEVFVSYLAEMKQTKKIMAFRQFVTWEAHAWAATASSFGLRISSE